MYSSNRVDVMNKCAFATFLYTFILVTFLALFAYSALLWREFLTPETTSNISSYHRQRPLFDRTQNTRHIQPIADKLQVYRKQLIVQLRRVQLDKRAEDEATKGNVYRVPTKYNRRRPQHLPGPSAVCSLPEVRVFRRGDEPFRSEKSDTFFPDKPRAHYNTCAIVSSAGSMLKSSLGQEIDSHDAVLRFNNAPMGDAYTEDVGSKTTHRVLNSQVVSKPEFDFFESPLYKNITLIVWDASVYHQRLEEWTKQPEHDVFTSYFLRRQIIPEEDFQLVDPRSLWKIWDFLDDTSPLPVIKNPPSSGLLGLSYMLHRCDHVDFYEYIPSMRLTRRCHYYAEHEDMGCTTGVWHPLAAEKLLVLNMTTSTNEDIFRVGKISFSRKDVC